MIDKLINSEDVLFGHRTKVEGWLFGETVKFFDHCKGLVGAKTRELDLNEFFGVEGSVVVSSPAERSG